MSPSPHFVTMGVTADVAYQLMNDMKIRHLPVMYADKPVGIVSERDIKLSRSVADAGNVRVEDIMTPDPYIVSETEDLGKVVLHMAEHKLGSALVLGSNGELAGIVTTTDILHCFGRFLRQSAKRAA